MLRPALRQTNNNYPNIEPSIFSIQWLDWGIWQIWSLAIKNKVYLLGTFIKINLTHFTTDVMFSGQRFAILSQKHGCVSAICFCFLYAAFSHLYIQTWNSCFSHYISICVHLLVLLRCSWRNLVRKIFYTEILTAQKLQHLECLLVVW